MQRGLFISGLGLALLGLGGTLLIMLHSHQNSSQLMAARSRLDSFDSDPEEERARWRELALRARERAIFYEERLSERHLVEGMVVHRYADGRAASICDSLLFSSLRFTALVKLGWLDKADEAWRAITRSYRDGRWLRHPQCPHQNTSRDQIFGLLTALSQRPALHVEHLRSLLAIVEQTDGSIDPGPFYVSRLSPSLSELIKQTSLANGLPFKKLPHEIRIGFSTLEFDTWSATPGYTSHLNALVLWNELELLDQQRSVRSLAGLIDGMSAKVWPLQLEAQRLQWSGQKLAAVDPHNLFFLYLKYRSAGALSYRVRADLLETMLAHKAFPADRLPQNCDRKADYLWQRASWEYSAQKGLACGEEFNGVDWLWMVALLTAED